MKNQDYTTIDNHTDTILTAYQKEVEVELSAILSYWMHNTKDAIHGGFLGKVDENNIPHPQAPKGAVLNSRILWAFASAYKITNDPDHLHLATIAFQYIRNYFIDKNDGGVYWTVDATGKPLDTKKQIYALAFAMYGCCAYFEASNNFEAKTIAIELYETIEKYSFDKLHTGYMEAFTKEWAAIEDLRLSDKDANEKKTMNTHLHVLEAYTTLYRIWPDEKLKDQLYNLIDNFTRHIIDPATNHLILFFDEEWNSRSTMISYGHDIEAAWLLQEAAEVIGDSILTDEIKISAIKIAIAAAEGLDTDGGLWYEYEADKQHLTKEKHWWVQAEAMIGFFNNWQLTNNEDDLKRSLQAWNYTNTFIKDKKHGEWHWGRNEYNEIMPGQDKVGIWKCPYHNIRACIEIINRIEHVKSELAIQS